MIGTCPHWMPRYRGRSGEAWPPPNPSACLSRCVCVEARPPDAVHLEGVEPDGALGVDVRPCRIEHRGPLGAGVDTAGSERLERVRVGDLVPPDPHLDEAVIGVRN